jgi:hypothetical protein
VQAEVGLAGILVSLLVTEPLPGPYPALTLFPHITTKHRPERDSDWGSLRAPSSVKVERLPRVTQRELRLHRPGADASPEAPRPGAADALWPCAVLSGLHATFRYQPWQGLQG